MKTSKTLLFVLFVFLITSLAFGTRIFAANNLNIDFDEPVYMENALEYTNFIREGKYNLLAWNETTFEHPALYKILYGILFLTQAPLDRFQKYDIIIGAPITESQSIEYGMAGRWMSLIFGTIAVGVLAALNPLAGFFMAVNTLSVKYTSMVYLEALPFLTSLLVILTYLKFFRGIKINQAANKKAYYWLILSGILLGVTAASKYLYCIVGIAIIIHMLLASLRKQIPPKFILWIAGWGILALAAFFVFNPYLWPHPLERFIASVTFHANYPSSQTVAEYSYPWWQPIRWLSLPFKFFNPRPTSAFPIQIDLVIFILAIIGLPRTARRQQIFFIWLVVGLATLLLWGTKWPQYTLIIMAPFCMAAGQGVMTLYELGKSYTTRLKIKRSMA